MDLLNCENPVHCLSFDLTSIFIELNNNLFCQYRRFHGFDVLINLRSSFPLGRMYSFTSLLLLRLNVIYRLRVLNNFSKKSFFLLMFAMFLFSFKIIVRPYIGILFTFCMSLYNIILQVLFNNFYTKFHLHNTPKNVIFNQIN